MGGVQRWSRRNWNQHPIPRFRGIEVRHWKQGNDPWSEVLDYMGCHQGNSQWKRVEIRNRGGWWGLGYRVRSGGSTHMRNGGQSNRHNNESWCSHERKDSIKSAKYLIDTTMSCGYACVNTWLWHITKTTYTHLSHKRKGWGVYIVYYETKSVFRTIQFYTISAAWLQKQAMTLQKHTNELKNETQMKVVQPSEQLTLKTPTRGV